MTLFGPVPTHFAKQAAEQDAWAVAGVSGVESAVYVENSGAPPEREYLEEHLANVIEWDPEINAGNVDVDTIRVTVENGHVTLTGTVPTWVAGDSAYESVVPTSGAADVDVNPAITS